MTKIPTIPKTNDGSHKAIRRGYAAGMIIEPGDVVPANTPVSNIWMIPANEFRESLIEPEAL
jgi:hypothetical protein